MRNRDGSPAVLPPHPAIAHARARHVGDTVAMVVAENAAAARDEKLSIFGGTAHVVDRILNHVNGAISGIARIYNRNEYAPERKAALEAWGRYIEGLVYPERALQNVVALRARRTA